MVANRATRQLEKGSKPCIKEKQGMFGDSTLIMETDGNMNLANTAERTHDRHGENMQRIVLSTRQRLSKEESV